MFLKFIFWSQSSGSLVWNIFQVFTTKLEQFFPISQL